MSDTTTTTEDTTPTTLAAVLAPGGTGSYIGTEDLTETTAEIGKTAVTLLRTEAKAAGLWRALAAMLIGVRATIEVTHSATGQTGPDWEAKSDLAKRYSSFAVTGPIAKANGDKEALGAPTKVLVARVQKGIENVLGRKVPGSESDLTLRESLILDWVKTHEGISEEDASAMFAAQFANLGRKTSAQKVAERQAAPENPAGPGTTTPVAPTVALTAAVDRIMAAETDSVNADLVTDATRILRRFAAQVVKSGEVTGRPEVLALWPDLVAGVEAISAYLAGTQSDGTSLRTFAGVAEPEAETVEAAA